MTSIVRTVLAAWFIAFNIAARLVGIWFTLLGSVAVLVAIYHSLTGGFDRAPEGPLFMSIAMIVAFGCAVAFGVVLLKVRSYRFDRPQPKPGDRVKWWTGEPIQ